MRELSIVDDIECCPKSLESGYECKFSTELRNPMMSVEELDTHKVGDVFWGDSRRILNPMVFVDAQGRAFTGFNEELSFHFRHGYEAYFYDLRQESHVDYEGLGSRAGQAMPIAKIDEVPADIDVTKDSMELYRWLLEAGLRFQRGRATELEARGLDCMYANDALEQARNAQAWFEDLLDGLQNKRLILQTGAYMVTSARVFNEERFKEYLAANPEDNIALEYPPLADEYLS